MNDEHPQVEPGGASRDGLAAVAITLLTVMLIILVISKTV
jgi:hypothetical protein